MPRLADLIAWSLEADWSSLTHQLRKRASLALAKRFGTWQRLQRRTGTHFTTGMGERWLSRVRAGNCLIGPPQRIQFDAWVRTNAPQADRIVQHAEELLKGRIDIFDAVHEMSWTSMPWHQDWRTGGSWPPQYFRDFSHHGSQVPGEVKFPWELSRMNWLVPLIQAALISGREEYRNCAIDGVRLWEAANPVAFSVNWHPMECAMRILNLAHAAMMMATDATTRPEHALPLLRQIALQGEFLARNIEYTTLRSNHFAANLAGLAMAGHATGGQWPGARRWLRYAHDHTCPEIMTQFHPDGVQFEGSVSYHRLVTELFLLTALILAKEKMPVPEQNLDRLHQACRYSAAYLRPDHTAPNCGDNDGARVLCFDSAPISDHRALIALGGALFLDRRLQSLGGPTAAAAWLGARPFVTGNGGCDAPAASGTEYFPDAGVLTCRSGGNYLFADYGGVGLCGRGGHGHNDVFSFELYLDGHAVVIDPGCPSYTGDLALYNQYRATAAHNTLQIDREEMAPMPDVWRISDAARPFEVCAETAGETVSISGSHAGYARLAEGLIHRRTLEFDGRLGLLRCLDQVICSGPHLTERHLHLGLGIQVRSVGSQSAELLNGDVPLGTLSWNAESSATIDSYEASPMFGIRLPAFVIRLRQSIQGNSTLSFRIKLS